MARSRLPLLRRISQIFFLLLFLALLIFTSLRPMPATTGDIHLRAPVRLFFEWDPLVAVANALARPRALSRAALEPDDSAADAFSGPLFLRLDLPDGHAAALRRQHAFGVEARQAAH